MSIYRASRFRNPSGEKGYVNCQYTGRVDSAAAAGRRVMSIYMVGNPAAPAGRRVMLIYRASKSRNPSGEKGYVDVRG